MCAPGTQVATSLLAGYTSPASDAASERAPATQFTCFNGHKRAHTDESECACGGPPSLLYCCFTAAFLLLYCSLTDALLLLYCCFTASLLMLYCCDSHDAYLLATPTKKL